MCIVISPQSSSTTKTSHGVSHKACGHKWSSHPLLQLWHRDVDTESRVSHTDRKAASPHPGRPGSLQRSGSNADEVNLVFCFYEEHMNFPV